MRLFGLDISRAVKTKSLSPPLESRWGSWGGGGWFPVIREAFAGAWQRNLVVDQELAISFHAMWTCVTLIAHDISKLRIKLIELQPNGIWSEITNSAYSPVLRDPNPYQNDHQFIESWMLSKLLRGNTYVLKRKHAGGGISDLYVLDAARVKPLVSDDGSVFYELQSDKISDIMEPVVVPARDIIHDRWNCMFHPLIGHSPIYAAGLAAHQGLEIQRTSHDFFHNRANASGLLTAPGNIDQDTASRLSDLWDENYSKANSGKVAVVGNGLTYQPLTITAADAQLIEQLKWSATTVAGAFHVPLYKAGIGEIPVRTSVEALNLEYYEQALQKLLEDAEGCLGRGFGLSSTLAVEFDLDGLLRMDTQAKIAAMKDAVGAGIFSIDEARAKFDLPPTEGGDSPYLQQQNYSVRALAKRDAQDDPFAPRSGASSASAPAPAPAQDPALASDSASASTADAVAGAAQANAALVEIYRGLGLNV